MIDRHTLRSLPGRFGLAGLLLLSACDKADQPPPKASVQASAAAPARTPAAATKRSAEEVARLAREGLKCPAAGAAPARADGAPVDDVLGVRPGMRFDEARAAVLCSNPLLVASDSRRRGFDLRVAQPAQAAQVRQGFEARIAEALVERTGKQIMQQMQDEAMARGSNKLREELKPGETKWFVGTMGPPGEERVLSAAREERFAAGDSPTVDSLVEALVKKYGAPTQAQHATRAQSQLLRWAHDPSGRPITEASPLYGRCIGTADPNGGVNLTPDCGIVVQALLIAPKSNPDLVERMQVGVVDSAGGWKMIAQTEQALGQIDQQRRAQEVKNATHQGKQPSL